MSDIVERLLLLKSAAAQSWAKEAAEEIKSLRQQLEAGQAREAKLRNWIMDSGMVAPDDPINYTLSFGRDNTAALRTFDEWVEGEFAIDNDSDSFEYRLAKRAWDAARGSK